LHCKQSTLTDAASLPVEELAALGLREGQRPRQIYQAHRWFARRFGSAFRALLTAAALPPDEDFWTHYYEGVNWYGRTVLDPFVGGGTSVVEASRFGADVIGIDVDAVACAITRFELRAALMPDLHDTLDQLKQEVGKRLSLYHQTMTPEGEPRDVLHYFWVQIVECRHCGADVEAHPTYQLAYEAEEIRQWVFCRSCHTVHTLSRVETELRCEQCRTVSPIHQGPVYYGRLTCPSCQYQERLIEVANRTGRFPEWRLFALEVVEPYSSNRSIPMTHRHFLPATTYDQGVFEAAERALQNRKNPDGSYRWIPDRCIPREGRTDDRLVKYGYTHYRELFNARQLLHLSCLSEAIDGLPEPVREAMVIAFSDHLTTNCMMTHYTYGWRRLAPLFSIRAYRHVTRPVEINPWMERTGRGTFPNAVRQVQRAIEFARSPKEPLVAGGFRSVLDPVTGIGEELRAPAMKVLQKNSQDLGFISNDTVDLVLTDPPYLDNIAYSELSDFFLPWLQLFGLAPPDGQSIEGFRENLAARGRDDVSVRDFQQALVNCLVEIARVLKPKGHLIFTFQHHTGGAWNALALALAKARLRPIQLFPLFGDGNAGLHKHDGTSKWDAVFVAVKGEVPENHSALRLSDTVLQGARNHWAMWIRRFSRWMVCPFRIPDQRNFYRACLVAGALGLFSGIDSDHNGMPLSVALEGPVPPISNSTEQVGHAPPH
jgi:putative DNA methylase